MSENHLQRPITFGGVVFISLVSGSYLAELPGLPLKAAAQTPDMAASFLKGMVEAYFANERELFENPPPSSPAIAPASEPEQPKGKKKRD